MHRKYFLLSMILLILLSFIVSAQENQTDLCTTPCSPVTSTCPDGFVASCTPGCDPVTGCGTCTPDCTGHEVVDKCAGKNCGVKATTCPDGVIVECKNTCDSATGNCIDCIPDCSGHQTTDKCAGKDCGTKSITCPDGVDVYCKNTCDPATGCGTCVPDCSGHQFAGRCGNGNCESGETCGQSNYCQADCGSCPICGNKKCEYPENYQTCWDDCPAPIVCGNQICESGESDANCPQDCRTPCPPAPAVPACSSGQELRKKYDEKGCVISYYCESFATAVCPARIEVKFDKETYRPGDRGRFTVNVYAPDGTVMTNVRFVLRGYIDGKFQTESSYTTPYESSGDVTAGTQPGIYTTEVKTNVPNCPSVSAAVKVKMETGGVCGDAVCGFGEDYTNCQQDCAKPTQQICTMKITPAKNPLTGECKEFPTTCDIPAGWQRVASCGETKPVTACPVYNDPICKDGYIVTGGSDPSGCRMPATCCGDGICSGNENQQNCGKDCLGQNCANAVTCTSGDGCCPSGCRPENDKDCGPMVQCPSGQNCPDGKFVPCYMKDNYCKCEPCSIPTQNIPQSCRQEKDSYSGIVRVICDMICPVDQEKIDAELKYALEKCNANSGRSVEKIDGRGCKYIDCQFTTTESSAISINPVYCPSPQQIDDTIAKCKSMGIEPLYTFDKGCKIVKCEEKREVGCGLVPGPERERIEKECAEKGLGVIKEFDRNGCQIIRCGGSGECARDVPQEAFEKCKNDGGELIVKSDYNGCIILSNCIRRGDERDIYVEQIEDIPESTELLAIAFKLEELKIELDKLARQTDDIAKYYASVDSGEQERFKRVSDMFDAAKAKVEEIKTKLRDRLQTITINDLMEIKHDIRYIKDVMLKDIVYVMLSSSNEVKEMVSKKEGDCGTDDSCFDMAFRVCKPVKFSPSSPPPGQEGGPPPGEEPDVMIIGLENDKCVIKFVMPPGKGPPAGVIPGINPPYEMKCRFSDYALGAQVMSHDTMIKYCEGNMVELIKMFASQPTQPAQQVPVSGGEGTTQTTERAGPCAGCLNNAICDPGECRDCPDCYGK